LEVSGSKKDIEALLKFIEGKDEDGKNMPFDFEKVLPTPPGLMGVTAPNRDDALAKEMKKKYGAPDWYEWRLANWSTKWNLGKETNLDVSPDGELATFSFDTAWSSPRGIINALGLKFPKLNFTLTYCESGMCFAGVYEVKGKKINDEYYEASKQKNAYDRIAEEFGLVFDEEEV